MTETQNTASRRSVTVSVPTWSGLTSRIGSPRISLGRFGRGRLRTVMLVLVLLVGIGDAVLLRQSAQQDDRASSRTDALRSARERLPVMLSYSYRTLDADLAVASGNATGSFRDQYAEVLRTVVAPNATKKKITTKAKVVGSGVVSGGGKKVTVLLLVTQSTITGSSQKPTMSGSRINVQMTKTDDGWFVSGITPV
jgi:Mce-associated membrane protein